MASPAALEKLLNYLIDIKAPTEMIDDVKNMIKKAELKGTQASNEYKMSMEAFRLNQMEGFKKHHQAIKMEMMSHDNQMAEIRAKINSDIEHSEKMRYQNELAGLEKQKELLKTREETAKKVDDFFTGKGLVLDFDKSPVGKFLNDMPGAFNAVGAAMASAIQPANLFAAGMMQVVSATKELFTDFDTAQTELSKVTATTGEYNDMLYDLQESNKTFGVDVETAGKAIGDLHNELSSFNQMSSATQGMLAETTARMEVLGVKTGSGAKQFDNMIQGMGMTATMANDASMELVALGGAIGMAADTITDGFNAAASELAKYGSDAIDVFKGLASAAKATGIEMGSLMSITKQFDTFEGAAAGAGKLNAILGGGVINSMDLLNGTEEDRIRLMIQAMQLSGKNFEIMNKHERLAIASAAGISDMTEANKLFSMSLSAYDEMQAKGSEANEQAAMMEERAQAVQTLTEKFKMIGQSFAIAFMPVLEFMHGFANMILMINDMTGGMFVPAMVGLIGIIALLAKRQAIANGVMAISNSILAIRATWTAVTTGQLTGLAIAESLAGTSATVAAPGTVAMGAAIKSLVPPPQLVLALLGIGMAFLGIGLAIAGPLLALAAIVTAFKDLFIAMLEAPKAIGAAITGLLAFAAAGAAALVIMAYGLVAATMILSGFAPAMAIIAPALLSFSFALLIAGAAMYLAGAGLKSFGEGLAAFNDVTPEALITAIVGLTAFAFGLIAFMTVASLPMLLVGIGLMLFGAGLKSFAKGLKEFNKVGLEEMAMAGLALVVFGLLLIKASLPMGIAALALGIPLMMIGAGLKSFGEGLAQFNKVGVEDVLMAAGSLILFGILMLKASFVMGLVGLVLAVPLMAISLALGMFADSMRKFRRVKLETIFIAALALAEIGYALLFLIPVALFLPLIAAGLMVIGPALGVFADGISNFASIGEDTLNGVLISIAGLALFAGVMSLLMKSGMIFEMVAGFFLLSIGLSVFGASLVIVGAGLAVVAQSMQTFMGLSETLGIISEIGLSGAMAMGILAASIMGIALALMFIPESKSIAFGFAMEGYGAALAAVAALSPDAVELSERVVTAAGEYAKIQAEMKMPDEDAFVQAMKNAFGGGDKKGDSGKNIILQLNGRELGRAVDVQLNKMHNLSID